jgi:hypothetical protein
MPQLQEQRDRIMIGPHRSMHNISNRCQYAPDQSSKQKEDYRSFWRRRRNVGHDAVF